MFPPQDRGRPNFWKFLAKNLFHCTQSWLMHSAIVADASLAYLHMPTCPVRLYKLIPVRVCRIYIYTHVHTYTCNVEDGREGGSLGLCSKFGANRWFNYDEMWTKSPKRSTVILCEMQSQLSKVPTGRKW